MLRQVTFKTWRKFPSNQILYTQQAKIDGCVTSKGREDGNIGKIFHQHKIMDKDYLVNCRVFVKKITDTLHKETEKYLKCSRNSYSISLRIIGTKGSQQTRHSKYSREEQSIQRQEIPDKLKIPAFLKYKNTLP